MKRYFKTYLTTFFITNIVFILLVILVRNRVSSVFPFIFLEIGILLISIFFSLSVWIFKLEKGNSIINVIVGYVFIIPGMFIIRRLFGNVLFRFTWVIYIVLVIIGIIYGIVVMVVSKKYQDEVKELNRLLSEKSDEKEE